MRLVACGYSNGDVGRALFVSEDTVKTHLRRAYIATGARDRAHLVAWAYLTGVLQVPRGVT